MAFSFIKLITSPDTLTKREAAILKICPPATLTSAEMIIAEYDAMLGQWERKNFYNHLSNYTNKKLILQTPLSRSPLSVPSKNNLPRHHHPLWMLCYVMLCYEKRAKVSNWIYMPFFIELARNIFLHWFSFFLSEILSVFPVKYFRAKNPKYR